MWVKQAFPNDLLIELLDAETERALAAFPERLIEKVNESKKQHIVIDEVQKNPQLLNVIHHLIEKHKNSQFILTGSSIVKDRFVTYNLRC